MSTLSWLCVIFAVAYLTKFLCQGSPRSFFTLKRKRHYKIEAVLEDRVFPEEIFLLIRIGKSISCYCVDATKLYKPVESIKKGGCVFWDISLGQKMFFVQNDTQSLDHGPA